jgi:hypothetical protein
MRKLIKTIKEKGVIYSLKKFFYKYFFTIFKIKGEKNKEQFTFNGSKYSYFQHPYNITWANERIVEVPIIKERVDAALAKKKKILEVGNVLPHYFRQKWYVLDKYEVGKNVINKDIVNYVPSNKYDLIVSISTLEHVGWDEIPKEPFKILKAIRNIRVHCLKSKGEAIVTLPLCYSPVLDNLVKNEKLNFDEAFYLKRISWDNKWVEIKKHELEFTGFDSPFLGAQEIIIGIIKK